MWGIKMYSKIKIKAWVLWVMFLATLLLGVLIIIWVDNATNTAIPLILMVFDFLAMSMILQLAVSKSFRFRPKKENYVENHYPLSDFESIKNNLNKNGFENKDMKYGFIASKIEDKVLYKVIVIYDNDLYFSDSEKNYDNSSSIKGVDECDKFIGFEIFKNMTDELKMKIADFSFQGPKIFYEGFYFDSLNQQLVEANALVPENDYDKLYNNMMEFLNFSK